MPSIDRLPPLPELAPRPADASRPRLGSSGGDFSETLKQFVSEVNEMQRVAGEKTLQFATGEIKDLHEVMAAAEEAGISLMLLMEIRNKALEAYKELMRIPV